MKIASKPVDRLDDLLDQVDSLPPAPTILPRLLRALTATNTDLNQLVDLISFDPALTAKLLQTCNSAFFSRSQPVNDVFEAVSRLGFQNVFRIVAMVTGGECLRPTRPCSLDTDRLWRHSVCAAFGAQFVAEDTAADAGMLFTAGILHDIGKVVLACAEETQHGLPGEIEAAEHRTLHAEIGARLLERWGFSPELTGSVRYHHEPWAAPDGATLAACVCLGDSLSHNLDVDSQELAKPDSETETAVKILELTQESLTRYQAVLKENLEFVEAVCRAQG